MSTDEGNLIERSLSDASGTQTTKARGWLYAVAARKFEQFKIAA